MSTDELLETHDSYELAEYRTLEELEPVGFHSYDFWFGQIAYMIYLVNAGKSRRYTLEDFTLQKHLDKLSGDYSNESYYESLERQGIIRRDMITGIYGYTDYGKQIALGKVCQVQ